VIAKRVAAHRKGAQVKVGGLIRYVADAKHDGAKVERFAFANCHNEDYKCVIREMEAVQGMNSRSQIDKTYHLVVSFQEGEVLTEAMLDDIEKEIANLLGYGAHQRMSAVNNDTDNLHMHVVINKVHPKRYTVHETYYDHYKLGVLCQRLEIKHDLKVDNHAEPKKTRASRHIDTEEIKKNGVEPLNEWLKDKLIVEQMTGWEDFHQQASLAGVSVILRGNGLALVDNCSGIGVKASSVSRDLGKGNLIKKWGDFQSQQKVHSAKHHYDGQATLKHRVSQSSTYWAAYQAKRGQLATFKHKELERLRDYQAKERKRISQENELERARIKLGRTIRGKAAKKKGYQLISAQRKKSLADLNAFAKAERQKIYVYAQSVSWRQFLMDKASTGDKGALKVLRRLKPEKIKEENFLSGEDKGVLIADKTMTLKDNGHVAYQRGDITVVDSGDKIFFKGGFDDESLALAVTLAESKFSDIKVNGTKAFKAAIEKNMGKDHIVVASKADALIDHFILERNKMAERVKDLQVHIKLSSSVTGKFTFTGLRRIGDSYALLCKSKDNIGVLAIDQKIFNQLEKVKRHSEITLQQGTSKIGGRKR